VADNVKKLPGDVSHLQRLIGDHAVDRGMPPPRLQRWLNAMIVTAVLDRVRDEDGEPIFLLKGGLAMELRLQLRARVPRATTTRRSVRGPRRPSTASTRRWLSPGITSA
jgi:hypothetical protein